MDTRLSPDLVNEQAVFEAETRKPDAGQQNIERRGLTHGLILIGA